MVLGWCVGAHARACGYGKEDAECEQAELVTHPQSAARRKIFFFSFSFLFLFLFGNKGLPDDDSVALRRRPTEGGKENKGEDEQRRRVNFRYFLRADLSVIKEPDDPGMTRRLTIDHTLDISEPFLEVGKTVKSTGHCALDGSQWRFVARDAVHRARTVAVDRAASIRDRRPRRVFPDCTRPRGRIKFGSGQVRQRLTMFVHLIRNIIFAHRLRNLSHPPFGLAQQSLDSIRLYPIRTFKTSRSCPWSYFSPSRFCVRLFSRPRIFECPFPFELANAYPASACLALETD